MKITLIWVAKTNASFLSEGIKEYTDRLKHYCQFSIVEIPECKSSSKTSFDEIKKKEGQAILAKLPQNATVFLLDENGKEYTSRQFSKIIAIGIQFVLQLFIKSSELDMVVYFDSFPFKHASYTSFI